VLIGINLLREGLDLPEVSLVAILDADKSGFLRSKRSLVQTIGRAARNVNGEVILYANEVTPAMEYAINETNRRREIQQAFNEEHDITPETIKKNISKVIRATEVSDDQEDYIIDLSVEEKDNLISILEDKMYAASENLEFEKAADLRDRIQELKENQND
jgi:excinuclease ABC subunit B